ncbi:HpcH/HpaI aldolase/citrate lyase family protein [Streptomyces sulphureus]|uniref:HpcH/HpaI aldolase/citrate lyase family protein n=1 Tax=Streptomyces sulphureus TaxID=47758 RepID=UPI00036CBB98|nr:CoA ester lyase [Streptomyces sulphureus]
MSGREATGWELAQALLFVPADRPDRFDKAVEASPHGAILDLEDAVPADRKAVARQAVVEWLTAGGRAMVRVNSPGTPWYEADVEAVAGCGCALMLPKAEEASVVADLARRGAGRPVIPLVETARGVEAADRLAAAPGAARLAFGNADLAAQLGVAHDDRLALGHARSRLVLASAAAGIAPPLDGITTALRDSAPAAEDAAHARRLGFGGKLCIHPAQVPAVLAGFAPSDEEVRWAHTVVEAGEGASAVDGAMVDRPLMERARRLLAQVHRGR